MMTLENYIEEMMNPKYRYLYIFFGAIGFILLAFQIVSNFPEINPDSTLLIALPDMILFFLAYKTYPAEGELES